MKWENRLYRYLGKNSPGRRSRATSAKALKWKHAGIFTGHQRGWSQVSKGEEKEIRSEKDWGWVFRALLRNLDLTEWEGKPLEFWAEETWSWTQEWHVFTGSLWLLCGVGDKLETTPEVQGWGTNGSDWVAAVDEMESGQILETSQSRMTGSAGRLWGGYEGEGISRRTVRFLAWATRRMELPFVEMEKLRSGNQEFGFGRVKEWGVCIWWIGSWIYRYSHWYIYINVYTYIHTHTCTYISGMCLPL